MTGFIIASTGACRAPATSDGAAKIGDATGPTQAPSVEASPAKAAAAQGGTAGNGNSAPAAMGSAAAAGSKAPSQPSLSTTGASGTGQGGAVAASAAAGVSGSSGAGGAQAMQTQASTVTAPATFKLLEHTWFSGPELGYDMQWMDRPFDLGAGPFSKVTLTFQLESPCFPFDKWTDNPPPSGQMFPAKCDRFDRLMYFEVDPQATSTATATAAPGLQVLRSITPYGGPLEKTVDITDFANTQPGPHSLRSFVGTWVDDKGEVSGSDGGYFLSVTIETQPGAAAQHALQVTSLYSGWVGKDTQLSDLSFTLPEGVHRAQLAYLVTGHGGAMDPSSACIGAADEFCKRTHHISVDGQELTPEGFDSPAFVPWRDDCGKLCTLAQGHPMMGTYCRENPNRMQNSVTAPRANWCPGDAVAPIVVRLPAAQASAGQHKLRFAIDDIYPDGRWQVALAVYAYAD